MAAQQEKLNERLRSTGAWLIERTGVLPVWNTVFRRPMPPGVGIWYSFGFALIFAFTVQAVTGLFLAVYYVPTPDYAYTSIQYIMLEVPFGAVIRGIHHWGASAMVVLAVVHLAIAYIYGAYKYPREMTWISGVVLLVLVLGFGFTGYLLPWDEKSYWATQVGTAIPGTLPVVGDISVRILRGGTQLGALTLSRFYAVHMLLLPAALAGILLVHLFLVVYHGVSVPPRIWEKGIPWPKTLFGSKSIPTPDFAEGKVHKARYEEMKHSSGITFWPHNVFEDMVLAAIVLFAIYGAFVLLGVPLEDRADPTNTAYIPRPDWYFLFLFQLLKVFPGSMEWMGAGVLPPVALLALLLLPIYDRSPWRAIGRRPLALILGVLAAIAVAVLTYLGAVS
jgi:ubiquinol-cytochrome c reductase cytochrome b subunit